MMASAGAVLSVIMWLQQLHDHRWVAPVPYGPRPRSNAQPNRPSIDYATALERQHRVWGGPAGARLDPGHEQLELPVVGVAVVGQDGERPARDVGEHDRRDLGRAGGGLVGRPEAVTVRSLAEGARGEHDGEGQQQGGL